MMTDRKHKFLSLNKSVSSQSGFTLLEIAIVLIIIGILTVPMLQIYKQYRYQQITIQTLTAMSETYNALREYYTNNGNYPCPAGRNLGSGNPNFGALNCAAAVPVGGCTADDVCRVAGINPGKTVLIGAVPFKDLGMNGSYAQDGYGYKLQYMITEDLTTNATATLAPNAAEIQEVNSVGANVSALQGVVFSNGDNGKGAYSSNGGLAGPCAAGTLDAENCNGDNIVIVSAPRSEASNANYFDDVFNQQGWVNPDLWDYAIPLPGLPPSDIYNKNTGNVGINNPAPVDALDVVGNIRTDSDLKAQQICDSSGANCFSPDLIGGPAGVAADCGTQALTGIVNGVQQCGGVTLPSLANKTCTGSPLGPYVIGFDLAGNVQCGP